MIFESSSKSKIQLYLKYLPCFYPTCSCPASAQPLIHWVENRRVWLSQRGHCHLFHPSFHFAVLCWHTQGARRVGWGTKQLHHAGNIYALYHLYVQQLYSVSADILVLEMARSILYLTQLLEGQFNFIKQIVNVRAEEEDWVLQEHPTPISVTPVDHKQDTVPV